MASVNTKTLLFKGLRTEMGMHMRDSCASRHTYAAYGKQNALTGHLCSDYEMSYGPDEYLYIVDDSY